MRWTRRSRAIAAIAVLAVAGIAWGAVWWFGRPQDAPAPPNPEPEAPPQEPTPEPAEPEPEVFSPHHLPGSWCFDEPYSHKTLAEWLEDKRPDVTASLTVALDDVLAGKRPLEECVLEVKWTEGGKGTSVTIHGDGLGIHWQGKQFQVSAEQRLELLRKLKAAKFLTTSDHLGKLPKDTEPPKEQDRARARGRIGLRIGKESKIVDHHNDGPANDEFVRFAKYFLTECLKHSTSGIGVRSLEDGLQKVLDHKLDVRVMQVEVGFVRPANSHTLQIEGLSSRIGGMSYYRSFRGQKSLTATEVATFITTIQGEKFQSLAFVSDGWDHFKTIKVRILNKEHSLSHMPSYGAREPSPADELRRYERVEWATRALTPELIYEKE